MYMYFITYLKFNFVFRLPYYTISNTVCTLRMAAVTDRFYSNSWVYPEDRFASNEQNLKFQLTERIGIPWDFSQYDWERGCSVADDVLRIILNELRNQVRLHFEGLEIHSDIIRQASARQGMRIIAPDEFDAVIPFTIAGLVLEEVRLRDISDHYLPGQIRLRVVDVAQIDRYPSLKEAGVFEMINSGTCFINAKALQELVFKSLMDKAFYVQSLVPKAIATSRIYYVTRGSRPPTMDLKIQDNVFGYVNVDFVPGFVLDSEIISIPGAVVSSFEDKPVIFPRYGLMKWINKENKYIDENDKNFIWRSCSSSYENFMFDLCVVSKERCYIRTACRVMKTLVHMLRQHQNQAANLLSSYHLKTVAMYCILLLTVPTKLTSPGYRLSGVREALGYFLSFLKLAMKKEVLPDFFLGNEHLDKIFPGSCFSKTRIKYNLFDKETPELVKSAKFGFPEFEKVLAGCFDAGNLNPQVVNFFETRLDVLRKNNGGYV